MRQCGLISSLQTEVGSVQSTLASDLADALTAIEEVETLVNDVASASDLQTVQDDLDGVSDNVSEILESNNVYSDNLVISSAATLAVAKSLGSKLAIINGNVTITSLSENITKTHDLILYEETYYLAQIYQTSCLHS